MVTGAEQCTKSFANGSCSTSFVLTKGEIISQVNSYSPEQSYFVEGWSLEEVGRYTCRKESSLQLH